MPSMDERIEALVQTAELLVLEGGRIQRSLTKLERTVTVLAESVGELKELASNHERRLRRLEGRKQ